MQKLAYLLATLGLAPLAQAQLTPGQSAPRQLAAQPRPTVLTVTPILGNDTMANPSVQIANLDDGLQIAGRTWWEFTEGVVWTESFLGYRWTPTAGAEVFEVPLPIFFQNILSSPTDIAASGAVCGTITSTQTFEVWPIRWTAETGTEFLIDPGIGLGGANTISDDGARVGGFLQTELFGAPQAAEWIDGNLMILGAPGAHSIVNAGSSDGSVLVGESGPDVANVQATRWIDGLEVGLAPVPNAISSTALHVSDDGTAALGRAKILGAGEGVDVLVRWAPDGSVATFAPPSGLFLDSIRAINPDATAAVGALTNDPTPFTGDADPYRWRLSDGFTLIPELGLPGDYDRSEAVDLSDDGERVVGNLSRWVFSPGSPPALAFVWTAEASTRDLQALVGDLGGPDLGLFNATAISGDGGRILAGGIVQPSPSDTSAVLIGVSEL